jgi:hypothetical protein
MSIQAALKRIGVEIAKEAKSKDGLRTTLYLRISPDYNHIWPAVISRFLLGSVKKAGYTTDVSKYYYAEAGYVKYLWRIQLTATEALGMEEAKSLLAQSALAANMEAAPEITSFPLVGRAVYRYDPAQPLKLKGGHDINDSQRALAFAIGNMGGPG